MNKLLALCFVSLLAGGCGPTLVKASTFDKVTVDLPMVARKRTMPLVIVLTRESIPDTIEVKDDDGGTTRVILKELRGWLGAQMKEAFAQLYDDVSVVEKASEVPPRRNVQIHVLLKRVTFDHTKGGFGNIIASQAKVTWSIGLRLSDEQEYFFSMNNTIGGDLTDFQPAIKTAFASAIKSFAADYVNNKLDQHEAPAAVKPAEPL